MSAASTPSADPVPPLPPAPPRRGSLLWLRLLVLAATGLGFFLPLIFAAVFRLHGQQEVEAAHDFLIDLRDGRSSTILPVLTPKARGDEEIPLPGKPLPPRLQVLDVLFKQAHTSGLQLFDFSMEPPLQSGEFLDVPFLLHYDESRVPSPTAMAQMGDPFPRSPQANAALRRLDGQRGMVHLQHINRRWWVSGLTLPVVSTGPASRTVPGPTVQTYKYDFEQSELSPLSLFSSERGQVNPFFGGLQSANAFDLLAPITAAEFTAAWQTDIDVTNRPARDILETLAREVGRPLDAAVSQRVRTIQENLDEPLARPVSLHLHRASRLQAIEEICRQVGVQPQYMPTSLVLASGRRSFPFAVEGPFLLMGSRVTEIYPSASGVLSLSLQVQTLPDKIKALFTLLPMQVSDVKVVGPAGEDLFHADKPIHVNPPLNYWGTRSPGTFFTLLIGPNGWAHWEVPLKNLVRDLDALAEVRCSLHTVLPAAVHTLDLNPVAPGSSVGAGGFRITLLKIDPSPAKTPGPPGNLNGLKRFDFRMQPANGARLCWRSRQVNGVLGEGWAYPTSSGDFSLFLQSEPMQLSVKILTPGEEIVSNFRLRNIPLDRSRRRIEPLRFKGYPMPVSVEAANLTDKVVEVNLVNHSQKSVDVLHLEITYRGREGRILGTAVRKVGQDARDDLDIMLVDPRSRPPLQAEEPSRWHIVDTGERPRGTARVSARVRRILFTDATVWQLDEPPRRQAP